jgi:SAM-dependent methyltransferase
MNSVFKEYSDYYDLIYINKNYEIEVDYIISLIKKYAPEARSVLDLGCGTGRHANLLAESGYVVVGVDYSEVMINIARNKLYTDYKRNAKNLTFVQGDARNFKSEQKFDLVISLFHVFSYLNSNEDVEDYFRTISCNLAPRGFAFFDYWYGPSVLNEKPSNRTARYQNDKTDICRISSPTLDINRSIVKIEFKIEFNSKKTNEIGNFYETHSMRYFFEQEISLFASKHGFVHKDCFKWLTNSKPSLDSWYSLSVITRDNV